MSNRAHLGAALCCVLATSLATPAHADGEILLTHAKALAGNVTPGDAAGYPITISIPGSFQLASNLFVAADKIGIQVTHPNVTIDLNGFTLQGSNVAWYGIASGANSVTIRNGTITLFEFDGIHGTGQAWIVENVRVFGNGRYGIYLPDEDPSVRGSTVTENASSGIHCGSRCLVESSNASANGGVGIFLDSPGTVLGNVIVSNTGLGIDSDGAFVGFGNNTLTNNNGGGANPQVSNGPVPLHPNACTVCP